MASYPGFALPTGATYAPSVLSFVVRHGRYTLGSASVTLGNAVAAVMCAILTYTHTYTHCIGVFGWLQSEYPFYSTAQYAYTEERVLSIKFAALAAPVAKVDPEYLGARIQLIVRGLKKEIT